MWNYVFVAAVSVAATYFYLEGGKAHSKHARSKASDGLSKIRRKHSFRGCSCKG